MSTNFYWKALPKALEKYDTQEKHDMLMHIGKRSAGGRYCYSCDNCRIVKYADDVFRPDCVLGLYKVMISIHELDNLVREGSIRCKHYINRLLGG